MKPSDAKKLKPGDVLMGRRFMGSWPRYVVTHVVVASPRVVRIYHGDTAWVSAADADLPSPEALAYWARKEEEAREAQAFNDEVRRVTSLLGGRSNTFSTQGRNAWGAKHDTYEITLNREQALALVERLEKVP